MDEQFDRFMHGPDPNVNGGSDDDEQQAQEPTEAAGQDAR